MLGFSPLASKAVADDGIVRLLFVVDNVVIAAPIINIPSFTVNVPLTSSITVAAPTVDVPTFVISYDFKNDDITVDAPAIDTTRLLGTPALSRVDIDGASAISILGVPVSLLFNSDSATDIMLLESKSNVILDGDGATVVIIDESDNDLAEVA